MVDSIRQRMETVMSVSVPMSAAYQLMAQPDWAATTTVAVADGSDHGPEEGAERRFSGGGTAGRRVGGGRAPAGSARTGLDGRGARGPGRRADPRPRRSAPAVRSRGP